MKSAKCRFVNGPARNKVWVQPTDAFDNPPFYLDICVAEPIKYTWTPGADGSPMFKRYTYKRYGRERNGGCFLYKV